MILSVEVLMSMWCEAAAEAVTWFPRRLIEAVSIFTERITALLCVTVKHEEQFV